MRYTTNWHQRATREEIDEVATLDRSIADLRLRRQELIALSSARRSGSPGIATRTGDQASAHAAHGQRNRPNPSVI